MTDRRLIESAFPLFEPLKPGRPARQTANGRDTRSIRRKNCNGLQ